MSMHLNLIFKEPIHGKLDQDAHDSISLEATADLDSAYQDRREARYHHAPDPVLNAQLGLAQSYLAYRLGFSDTADDVIPSKKDVEAAAEHLVAQGLRVEDSTVLIKAAIDMVDRKIDEEVAKLPIAERVHSTTGTLVGR